ncbi:MAG: hypothetical protein JWQ49_1420 [Edaphobacter sp.]|nr:hypothetical protein [Edaphobacter sp.]
MVIRQFAAKRWPEIALILALLSTCACVLASSSYTRGTDQFWYVADVESLVRGEHVTNNIFPANLATPGPLPGPFVHNNITLYLVVPLATLLGGHWGWLATNLMCTVGSALLVFMSLQEISVRVAALVASFFLVLPLTVWLTCTELSEPIYGFLASLCLFVWLHAKQPLGQGLFVVAAAAAALAKDNLAILLLVPVVGICLGRAEWRRTFGITMYLAGISALGLTVFAVLRSTVFTENIHYSLAARLICTVPPKNDNMAPFFLSSPPSFEWAVFWAKLARNIPGLARFAPAEAPFILPFYTLLSLFLWYLVRNWKRLQIECKETRASLVTIILIISYFATVLFFQNQWRFTYFVIPCLLVSTALFVRWTERKMQMLGLCVACLVPVALVLVLHIRKESMQQFVETKRIEQSVESHLTDKTPLLILREPSDGRFIEVAFAVRPRAALIIDQSGFCDQLKRYRARFDARYIIGRASFLAARSKHVADIEDDGIRYADYGIYDLQASCP